MRSSNLRPVPGHASVCWISLVVLVFLTLLPGAGCRPRPDSEDGVSLRFTTAEPTIHTGVEITFGEPMVDFDVVGQTNPTSPIRIQPAVPGTFVWLSRRSGLFTPSQPLSLGTTYHLELVAGLTNLSGKPSTASLHRKLQLPGLSAFVHSPDVWMGGTIGSNPSFTAIFNAEVEPAALERHAYFTDGTQRVNVRVQPPEEPGSMLPTILPPPPVPSPFPPAQFSLEITPARPLVSTSAWRLILKAGLPARAQGLRLERPFELVVGSSPPFRVTQFKPISSRSRGRSLRIDLSRPADRAMLSNPPSLWLQVEPPVPDLTVETAYANTALSLHGGFQLDQTYRFRVGTNLVSADGLQLAEPAEFEGGFDPIKPAVWLTTRDAVQLARGQRTLDFQAINTPEIRLRLKQLDRYTLIHTLRAYERYRRYEAPWEPDIIPPGPLDYAGIAGRTVLDTNLTLAADIDRPIVRSLPLDQLLNGREAGAFFIEVDLHRLPQSTYPSGTLVGPQSVLQLTDLGLVWKRGRNSTRVWVFSHATAKPVPDARVTLATGENEPLLEARTGADGIAVLPASAKAEWILVESGQDLHAEPIGSGELSLWPFELATATEPADDQRIFAFTDREAYRPGESLNLHAFVRSWKQPSWAFPTNPHVQLEIHSPHLDEVILRTNLTLDATGSVNWSWATPRSGRGTYKAQLSTSNTVASLPFEVRDFQPAAFDLAVNVLPSYPAGAPIRIPVTARYLHGQPLTRADVLWSVDDADTRFTPDGWDDFEFGADADHLLPGTSSPVPGSGHQSARTILTPSQPLVIESSPATNPVVPSPQTRTVTVEATDLNQQTIVRVAETTLHSSAFYLGFQWADAIETVLSTNAPTTARLVAVTPEGRPWSASVPVTARLSRVRWHSVAVQRAGRVVGHEDHAELVPVLEDRFTIESAQGERSRGDVPPGARTWVMPGIGEPGTYQLEFRAQDPEGRPVVSSQVFHVSGDARLAWHQRNGLQLELVPSRDTHPPGNAATLLARTPFSGTAWVTLEREDVQLSFVTNLTGNAPALQLPITGGDVPNTFASVTLVRGAADSPHAHPMPEWRVGYLELPVPPLSTRLTVEVSHPTNAVAPGEPIPVRISVRTHAGEPVPEATLTVYAVDEGYLRLKDTAVPDPWKAYSESRPLLVQTALSLPGLHAEDPERREFDNKGHMAGGGGRQLQVRSQFNPCPLWETRLRTDANGSATTTFTAPDALTRYRTVAIATHGPDRFGSGNASIEVRKLLMIESALPRFAHVGDRLQARAIVLNSGPATVEARVTCTAPPQARIGDSPTVTRQITIPPGESRPFDVPAEFISPGEGTWRWSVEGHGLLDVLESSFTVSHAGTHRRSISRLSIPTTGGSLLEGLDPVILESPESINVRVAAGPIALVGEGIRQLVHYPYGCVEQTGSSLLPWIALKDLPGIRPSGDGLPTNALVAIQAGVDRFWSMQLASGALSYWPGASEPHPWGSAYAAWILALARQAGAEVNPARQERLLTWLEQTSRGASPDSPSRISPEMFQVRCLAALALAESGRRASGLEAELIDLAPVLSSEDRTLLALALLAANPRHPAVRDILALPARNDPGLFGGKARILALQLLVHARLDPRSADSLRLIDALLAEQRNGHWQTTQGNAWAVLALASVSLLDPTQGAIDGHLNLDGDPLRFSLNTFLPVMTFNRRLSTNSQARLLNHTGNKSLFVEVTVQAAPLQLPESAPALNRGFALQRTYQRLDDANQPGEARDLRPGDRILVTLQIDAPEDADWVAIEDPVPSILEPVQAVFRTQGTPLPALAAEWSSDFVELRSDRMQFFRNHLPEGRHRIRYVARVRAAGDAIAAPAQVEAMYDPERHGLSTSSRLKAASN